ETAARAGCDGRVRLWMGSAALLPHRSNDIAESIAETATEAIARFDGSEDRRSLLRPYVSGLFEYGRPAVFDCARNLLTYADRMEWPEWAVTALACSYVPSGKDGIALIADAPLLCFSPGQLLSSAPYCRTLD